MQDKKSSKYPYWALVMSDRIDHMQSFETEKELDEFSLPLTKFSDDEAAQRLAEGNDYGPPVIFAFFATDFDAVYKNNFDRPVAIYLRGEKYTCVRSGEEQKPIDAKTN